MGVTITKEHLALAKRLGACGDRLAMYQAGQPIHEVALSDLAWIASRAPQQAAALSAQLCEAAGIVCRAPLPLEMFGDGSGSGYGSRYGYGDGYGSGSGDGSGSGYGVATQ